ARRDARSKRVEAEAALVRQTANGTFDIPYGPHPRQRIDVFHPAVPKGPLLAFFHGGYWMRRSKNEFAWMAPAFTAEGITFATIGYPLCPQVRISEIVASASSALCHLHDASASFGFDNRRIHVAGHSAGGHLAAMMATVDFTEWGRPAGLVTSATCVAGLYDLEPLLRVRINTELGLTAADVEAYSPMRLAPMPHVVVNLTVGDQDGAEFQRNTAELAAAWRAIDIDVTDVPAKGFHHFDVLDEFGRAGRPMHARLMKTMLD
ncbi:unnamed protein product, partial [Phaeothamnion confervicola]